MKVKTLLESLVKINKNDAIVCLHHPEGDRVTFVCGYEKNVWLESEKEDPGEYKMCTDRSTVGWLIYTLGYTSSHGGWRRSSFRCFFYQSPKIQ